MKPPSLHSSSSQKESSSGRAAPSRMRLSRWLRWRRTRSKRWRGGGGGGAGWGGVVGGGGGAGGAGGGGGGGLCDLGRGDVETPRRRGGRAADEAQVLGGEQ